MLRVSVQETQAGELVDRSVLEQAQLLAGNTPAGYHLYVHLHPLAGIGHLLVRLGLVGFFLLRHWEQPRLAHHPEQALRAAGIAPKPQPVP